MDKITLKSLTFHGKHGYYEKERLEGNQFELDVTAEGNFRPSIKNDDLSGTFNYEIVETVAINVFEGASEKLIESLCEKIGSEIFKQCDNIATLSVSLRKLSPPIKTPAAYAEITMEWKRSL